MKKNSAILKLAQSLVRKSDVFLDKHGMKNYHLEARTLLDRSSLAHDFRYQDLVESTLSSRFKTIQNFSALEFSDLPITLAQGKNCFLDLYFWRRRPTVIHNHHFCGAFQCLEGANIDLQYKFKKKTSLGRYHCLGELSLVGTRELKKGDSESIDFQDKFIHQNHHQSDLTVNLCLRTVDVPDRHIANFLISGLRYEKNPLMMSRVLRLWRFTSLGDFDRKKINFTHDEAICFLLETYGSASQNVRFLKLRDFLLKKVKKELGISIDKLIIQHEMAFDQMLDQYD